MVRRRGGILRRPLTGPFIRDYLEEHGEGYAYEIWKSLKNVREELDQKPPTYQSFYQNYIWKAEQLGLIETVRTEEGFGRFDRKYYRIVPGEEDAPCWSHVQVCYQPVTQLGAEDYRDLKEEARRRDLTAEETFVQNYYDKIEDVAEELDVDVEVIEERVRRSRPFQKLGVG